MDVLDLPNTVMSAVTAALLAAAPAPQPGEAPRADREAVFWASAQASGNPAELQEYLRQYPGGTFANLARLRLATIGAPTQAKGLTGFWAAETHGLKLTLEERPDGTLVLRQANPDDPYAYLGDTVGEAKRNAIGEYTGRHAWGGRRSGDLQWGLEGGLVVRRLGEDRLLVQHLDSKYQGGWTFFRRKTG